MEARVENEEVPVITQLYPVAPNPVDLSQDQRRAVKFSFALAEPGQVKLNIYNIKGQKVRKITSQLYNAGWHEIYWQADDDRGRLVCSGIYLLSMECPGFSRQKKFIVIK
jgi:flagellar hook assembly protein FlgD